MNSKTNDAIGFNTITGATIGEVMAEGMDKTLKSTKNLLVKFSLKKYKTTIRENPLQDHTGDGVTDIILPSYTLNQIILLEQNKPLCARGC